ncbi:NADP-dependent oxidoreductase domain-containing protein [Gigaspora rosea]|uniref:NADP-dependent oxidoreductase domain-containing protein n=1 Tax=Gigaspora rosea TaxID=44941 RepID=A0A397UBH0_9GLOM|nr:NADP-dependent oxidoreductase domain-containing protein [Gigaspora rosea]
MATDTSHTQEALTKIDNYVSLGASGLKVSPLCLGTMTFGQQDTKEKDDDIVTSKQVFDKYCELGGNFFDASNFGTGESERILGQYIADKRSSVIVSTKYSSHPEVQNSMDPNLGGPNRKSLVENLSASLGRLGFGYIDILYTHLDYRYDIENILRALDDVALYIAVTNTPAWVISEAKTISQFRGWSFLSNRYTKEFLNSGADFPAKKVVLEYSKKEKNWKILEEVVKVAGEIGRTPSQVAINWTLQQPGVTSVVAAARNVNILEENIKAMEFKLTPEHLSALNDVSLPIEILPFAQIPKPNPLYNSSQPTSEYISSLKALDESKTTVIEFNKNKSETKNQIKENYHLLILREKICGKKLIKENEIQMNSVSTNIELEECKMALLERYVKLRKEASEVEAIELQNQTERNMGLI